MNAHNQPIFSIVSYVSTQHYTIYLSLNRQISKIMSFRKGNIPDSNQTKFYFQVQNIRLLLYVNGHLMILNGIFLK